jgi:hypothetical protein
MHAAAPMWRYGGRNGLKIQRFTREAHYLSLIYGQYDCLRMLRPLLSVDQVKLAIAAALRRLCARYAIKAERTRHKRLVQLLAAAVDQCGQVLALKAATQLHKQAGSAVKAPFNDHLAGFPQAWRDITEKQVAKLNPAEWRAYSACECETERSAFLIIAQLACARRRLCSPRHTGCGLRGDRGNIPDCCTRASVPES